MSCRGLNTAYIFDTLSTFAPVDRSGPGQAPDCASFVCGESSAQPQVGVLHSWINEGHQPHLHSGLSFLNLSEVPSTKYQVPTRSIPSN